MTFAPSTAPIARLVAERFGGPTVTESRGITVSSSVSQLVPQRPGRFGLFVMAMPATRLLLFWDREIAFDRAIVLAPGSSIWLTADEDGELPTYELHCIGVGGPPKALIVEVSRV